MMAPTLSPGAGAAAGGSLVAERNASLASCLVRSTNAICCDASTGTHRTWSCGAGCQPARRWQPPLPCANVRAYPLGRARFGDHLPLTRRQDVKGFVNRKPVWLIRPLPLDIVRDR